MKSKILISVDFNSNNEPVIEILLSKDSPDLRDQMLKSFLHSLGGSNILKLEFGDDTEAQTARYIIRAFPAHKSIQNLFHPQLQDLLEQNDHISIQK